MRHVIPYLPDPPAVDDGFDDARWSGVPPLAVDRFRTESAAYRPLTRLRLAWSEAGLHGRFRVEDRFVVCRHAGFQVPVHLDSCVEIFLQPAGGRGYLNFEFNCGGARTVSHVIDPRRTAEGFADWRPLREDEAAGLRAAATLPPTLPGEVAGPLDWELGVLLPWEIFAGTGAATPPRAGDEWRGNAHKCADGCSQPHWAAWAPLAERNFHRPEDFGVLEFGAEPSPLTRRS